MSPIPADPRTFEHAILKTILYSDLFDYALTPDEIARYLVEVEATADEVRAHLAESAWLNNRVRQIDGYVTARGREALVQRRLERTRSSVRLWRRAQRFVRVLSWLPFVRMVAVTGALAVSNSAAGDDIDVLIVTAPHRVWLARALAVALVYAGHLLGDTLCPNYVISENALALSNHSLFVAHEFAQMVPMYGRDVYDRMRAANTWIEAMLPNMVCPVSAEIERQPGLIVRTLKRALEALLSGRLGDRLESWEMERKLRKFQPQLGWPDGDAILDRDHVKGHFQDYGGPVMRSYTERLAQLET
jgi:hypothetical protein